MTAKIVSPLTPYMVLLVKSEMPNTGEAGVGVESPPSSMIEAHEPVLTVGPAASVLPTLSPVRPHCHENGVQSLNRLSLSREVGREGVPWARLDRTRHWRAGAAPRERAATAAAAAARQAASSERRETSDAGKEERELGVGVALVIFVTFAIVRLFSLVFRSSPLLHTHASTTRARYRYSPSLTATTQLERKRKRKKHTYIS